MYLLQVMNWEVLYLIRKLGACKSFSCLHGIGKRDIDHVFKFSSLVSSLTLYEQLKLWLDKSPRSTSIKG